MCGRFYVDDETVSEIEKIVQNIDQQMIKKGDIYPSKMALILRASKDEAVAEVMKWGYEAAGKSGIIFNARAESVQDKQMFRYDYETHRCMIPAKKFYEWKKLENKEKEKYDFFVPDDILYLAGIYHKAPEGNRFVILTREAEGCMVEVHNRMPVILTADEIEKWLFSREEAVKLLDSHFHKLQKRKSSQKEYRQLSLF